MPPLLTRYSLAIVWRHYLVWRQLLWPSLVSNVFNPVLFLFAFGFGLGNFIERMDGLAYLDFIVPGMVAYGAMFAASFETTIGAYSRYAMQRTWDAMLATPVTLSELLIGEVLWATAKAMLSACSVLLVGAVWGGVPSVAGALLGLVAMVLGSLVFSCCGLAATAYARGYEFFSYFFTFWVTPMFIFCGVFFDIERFPDPVQAFAWLLPMTHLVEVVRPLGTGQPLSGAMLSLHLAYLVCLGALAFWVAYRRIRQRMFD